MTNTENTTETLLTLNWTTDDVREAISGTDLPLDQAVEVVRDSVHILELAASDAAAAAIEDALYYLASSGASL